MPRGLKNEVIVQMGHVVSYGAPVDQAIRIAGGKPVLDRPGDVGLSLSHRRRHQRAHGGCRLRRLPPCGSSTALSGLKEFAEACHAKGVPVIVDAASEYDLQHLPRTGRGHRRSIPVTNSWAARPPASSPAKRTLVRNAFLQNLGIGRGMKVGKESMLGVMAALMAWETRDHTGDPRPRGRLSPSLARHARRPPGRQARDRSRPDRQSARPPARHHRSAGSPHHRLGSRRCAGARSRRRSSCATTRSSTITSISTPATCTPARKPSWQTAFPRS